VQGERSALDLLPKRAGAITPEEWKVGLDIYGSASRLIEALSGSRKKCKQTLARIRGVQAAEAQRERLGLLLQAAMHEGLEALTEFFQRSENEYLAIAIYYNQNKEQIPEALAPVFPAFLEAVRTKRRREEEERERQRQEEKLLRQQREEKERNEREERERIARLEAEERLNQRLDALQKEVQDFRDKEPSQFVGEISQHA
jgi:murein hydrolase activator